VSEETLSAVACFIFIWFLIKPYRATGENRYLGLPLGFGFLGVSYLLAAITHGLSSYPVFTINSLTWFQLLARPFAFAFLTFTYFFSNKPLTKRPLWNISLSVLLVALMSLIILFFVAPQFARSNCFFLGICVRIFNMVCLLYISVHTLRSHLEAKKSKTILIPFGFIFLTISQYSLLLWSIDNSRIVFYGGLVLRWIGLALFLLVAYRSFYSPKKRSSE
jgi:hypothetical protein